MKSRSTSPSAGELGSLTPEGRRVVLLPNGGPQWVLERLG